MKTFLKVFLTVQLLSVSSIAKTAENPKIITIGTLENSPLANTVIEIAKVIYKKLDYEITINKLPALRSLEKANSGEFDAELYRIAGMEKKYPNLVKVPVPLFTAPMIAYATKDIDISKGWESLRPYRLVYRRGVKIVEDNTQGMNALVLNTNTAIFNFLKADRADIAIMTGTGTDTFIEHNKFTGIKALQPPLANLVLFHYLNKKNEELVPKIAKIIEDMTKNNEFSEIIKKAALIEPEEKDTESTPEKK